MRFMVIVKATSDSEAGIMPSEKLLRDMGNFNEELVKAGIMLAGEGLHPSSRGKRIRFSGGKRTVVDCIKQPLRAARRQVRSRHHQAQLADQRAVVVMHAPQHRPVHQQRGGLRCVVGVERIEGIERHERCHRIVCRLARGLRRTRPPP